MNKNRIQYNPNKKECLYYPDRLKIYEFHTNKEGCELLKRLEKITKMLLEYNKKLIMENKKNKINNIEEVGIKTYAIKPSLRINNNKRVTWSINEYGHLGFQKIYLELKSIQRFTETYNLLQRVYFRDFFLKYENISETVTFLSVGGGPGFELIAAQYFFEKYFPKIKLELISLDIQKSWEKYTQRIGIEFIESNITNGKIIDLKYFKNSYNDIYLIFSYVLIYVTDDKTVLLIKSLLENDNVKGIFISERQPRNKIIPLFIKHNIRVIYLLPYLKGNKDDRQLLLLKKSNDTSGSGLSKFNKNSEKKITFPNVPWVN